MDREKVIAIREELREKLEAKNKKAKVGKIVYYEDFEVIKGNKNYNSFSEKDLFIVTRKVKQDGLELEYYELYDEKYMLIGTTYGNGQIQYSKNYIEKLGPIYSYLGLEERQMYLSRENEFVVNDKPEDKLTKNNIEENKVKEAGYKERKVDTPEPALMEEDLGLNRKSISYCQEIKDKRFFDKVTESSDFSKTAILIYSDELKTFMIIGIKDGKFKPYTTIEPAESTMKSTIDLNNDGSKVQKDTITGILKFNKSNYYDFSVDIETDGTIEFQELRKDPITNEYISSDLETEKQYRANWRVEQMMDREKNNDITSEVKRFENLGKETKIEEIEDDKQKVPWDRNPRR